jgi:hypothetical protein
METKTIIVTITTKQPHFASLKKTREQVKIFIIYYFLLTGWYVNDACLYPFNRHLS